MPQSDIYPSDFELLHLAFSSNTLEKEIVWLLSHYCWYVWELKKKNNNRFIADVDKLRSYLMKEYCLTQFCWFKKLKLKLVRVKLGYPQIASMCMEKEEKERIMPSLVATTYALASTTFAPIVLYSISVQHSTDCAPYKNIRAVHN